MYSFARKCGWVTIERAEANTELEQLKILLELFTEVNSFDASLGMHSTQSAGLTLEKAIIRFDLVKQLSFNYRQLYVALARVISLYGLYLIGSDRQT